MRVGFGFFAWGCAGGIGIAGFVDCDGVFGREVEFCEPEVEGEAGDAAAYDGDVHFPC